MMRVGVLFGGMEVEHLKSRPFDSPISTASPSIASSSAASSSADLVNVARLSQEERKTELELDSYRNAISSADVCSFKGYDKTTLHTPPSEMLVIARAQPRRRPGLGGDADGAFSRVDSLQSVPEAQKIGELDSVTK
jgi:stearoyl-CoA desaturase (delta-9 desaturase)